jgi:signal transduction histidine kinase
LRHNEILFHLWRRGRHCCRYLREQARREDLRPVDRTRGSCFSNHPAALGKNIYFADVYPAVAIETDISLLSRVLCNMIINALEATEENGSVRVGATSKNGRLSLCVWNAGEIPADIAKRVFQRDFSTKAQAGRGIGTFSMMLFGEKYLGGRVDFTTSSSDGTVFRFILPLTAGKAISEKQADTGRAVDGHFQMKP